MRAVSIHKSCNTSLAVRPCNAKQGKDLNDFFFLPTGTRYIPLLLDSGIMESIQELCKTPLNGVSELAQKLINTVADFKSSVK